MCRFWRHHFFWDVTIFVATTFLTHVSKLSSATPPGCAPAPPPRSQCGRLSCPRCSFIFAGQLPLVHSCEMSRRFITGDREAAQLLSLRELSDRHTAATH